MIRKKKLLSLDEKSIWKIFQFKFPKNKKEKIYINQSTKFRRFGGRIKGVRPTNRSLVLLLPQTSDRNSFNLDLLNKQINYYTKRFTRSAMLDINRWNLDLLLSSGKHVLFLFLVFLSISLRSPHTCVHFILSDPIATLETLSVRFQTGPLLEERSLGRRLCCGLAPTKLPPTVYALPTPGFVCQKTAIRGS